MGHSAPPRQPHAIDTQVGVFLRQRRKELGMSMKKLADAAGITYQQIQKYETGTNRVPASRLAVLARILGVEPGQFYQAATEGGFGEEGQDAFSMGPADERIRLLKAYDLIDSPHARDTLVQLAEQMAKNGEANNISPMAKSRRT
ncbi:transcriptional regulator with XRE-family HTH domain [Maritalea mobilis]|uniref:Transcriptional regulator with XRE-family HTH domain n=1 Tax=Maritalea mobilis TaxID=483324 RepID=A0A4R6VGE4_9HYPH|nr:helix-turn-helix transcriptional regulator [Maritalea mobilis]TDQ61881.1 transcriptional regulator with XRE-family HTH domain [Maritalea mobilis]